MSVRTNCFLMTLIGAVSLSAFAAPTDAVRDASRMTGMAIQGGPNMIVPLKSWPVDAQSFIAQHQKGGGTLKAASDLATVYRPIPVCRLIDTRGFPAFITIPGPLLAGSNTNVTPNGACGIPKVDVAGLSVAITVMNLTPNNGGFIALLQQGSPVNGINAVFNTGAIWTATTGNVSIPDDSGNFFIHIDQSNVQVVIDVNGYYQDLDNVDVGTQELDIVGTVDGGDVFEVTNTGTGSALSGTNFGSGPGIRINSGSFAVAGAGIGSGTTAFVMEIDTANAFGNPGAGNLCGGQPSIAVIDNPISNGAAASSAMLLVTPRENAPSSLGTAAPSGSTGPVSAFWLKGGECTPDAPNHWAIRDKSGASLVNLSQYSVFIIKAQ